MADFGDDTFKCIFLEWMNEFWLKFHRYFLFGIISLVAPNRWQATAKFDNAYVHHQASMS